MQRLGKTSLSFLGRRTYLHSTEIFHLFCNMLGALPADRQPVHVISFKFLHETSRNGEAFLLEADEPTPAGAKPVSTIVFRDREGRRRRFEMTDDGAPIAERQPDPPPYCDIPAMTGNFSGTVACNHIASPSDFFAALMEASKAIHVETLRRRGEDPNQLYRFVSCEGMDLPSAVPPAGSLTLTFRHVRARRLGARSFTFNDVTWEPGAGTPVRVCVAY
jgi:hypothetical protein